jgi:hypothetical protein
VTIVQASLRYLLGFALDLAKLFNQSSDYSIDAYLRFLDRLYFFLISFNQFDILFGVLFAESFNKFYLLGYQLNRWRH